MLFTPFPPIHKIQQYHPRTQFWFALLMQFGLPRKGIHPFAGCAPAFAIDHEVDLEKKGGGVPERGVALSTSHQGRSQKAPASQPGLRSITDGRGLVSGVAICTRLILAPAWDYLQRTQRQRRSQEFSCDLELRSPVVATWRRNAVQLKSVDEKIRTGKGRARQRVRTRRTECVEEEGRFLNPPSIPVFPPIPASPASLEPPPLPEPTRSPHSYHPLRFTPCT